jgi:hypothetical protein
MAVKEPKPRRAGGEYQVIPFSRADEEGVLLLRYLIISSFHDRL